MMQSPPAPSPSPLHPHHHHAHHPLPPAAHAPFLAAFPPPGAGRMVTGDGGLQLHPAFLHPLYPLPPGLASLRAAAAGAGLLAAAAAASATGAGVGGVGGGGGVSPTSPDRNKSFTIDAILGREAQKLAGGTEGRFLQGQGNAPQEEGLEGVVTLTKDAEGSKDGMGLSTSGYRREGGLVPPAHQHPLSGGQGTPGRPHPRLHPHPHHPYLSQLTGQLTGQLAGQLGQLTGQLTCNPGFSFRHHHNPYSRDKSDKKGGVSSEWKAGKAKRVRTIFTPEQLERLEAEFERQQYMVGTERYYLAASLNLTEAQVKVWFQNRRIKWRKQNLEQQHAKLAKLDLLAKRGEEDEDDEDDSDDVSESDAEVPDVRIQNGGVGDVMGDVSRVGDVMGDVIGDVIEQRADLSPASLDDVKADVMIMADRDERQCPN